MNYLIMPNVPDQYRTIRTPLYEEESEKDYDDMKNMMTKLKKMMLWE